jgi:hypothetical protein
LFCLWMMKLNSGGLNRSQHPRMVRMETLFRELLDAPDRGISRSTEV